MTTEEFRMLKKEMDTRSRDQLLMVIFELREKVAKYEDKIAEAEDRIKEYDNQRAENERAMTAMAKEYQTLLMKSNAQSKEIKTLQEALTHAVQVNQLRTNELFGRSTEKFKDVLDNPPASVETDEADQEPEQGDNPGNDAPAAKHGTTSQEGKRQDSSHKGRKTVGKREADFSRLPKDELFQLDVEALNKKYGEGNWRIVSWHRHSYLEIKPAEAYVRVIYTPVISVGLEHHLETIPYEPPLWPRSFASPSIVAYLNYYRYHLATPFNRLENLFKDFGIVLSKQTMSNWNLHFADVSFGPIYEYLIERLKGMHYQQCDETTLTVVRDERGAGKKSYMWVHTSSELSDDDPLIVVFCFEQSRGTDHLREFYSDFHGALVCDAYSAYKTLGKEKEGFIIICGCMMHLRRKFFYSLSLIDCSKMDQNTIESLPETKALEIIGKIYDAEGPLKTLTAHDRQKRRDSEVRPLVEEYFEYIESLDTNDPSMSEQLRDAVNYSKNQKEYLCHFLDDGNITLDNGHVERQIRPFALMRHNSLFCDSVNGAKSAATMYSIVETAQANGANVYWYLRYVLEKMPHEEEPLKDEFLETMMPWSQEYQEYEKIRIAEGPPDLQENKYSREKPKTPRKGQECTGKDETVQSA